MASAEASIKNAKKAEAVILDLEAGRGCVVVEVESRDYEGPNFFDCLGGDFPRVPCRFSEHPGDHKRACPYDALCADCHKQGVGKARGDVVILEEAD